MSDHATIGRRSELIAELFLQDLDPSYVLESDGLDVGFDFLLGVPNECGGINSVAVAVKTLSETPVSDYLDIDCNEFRRLRNSNLPILMLWIDEKTRDVWFGFPTDDPAPEETLSSVKIGVRRAENGVLDALVERLRKFS